MFVFRGSKLAFRPPLPRIALYRVKERPFIVLFSRCRRADTYQLRSLLFLIWTYRLFRIGLFWRKSCAMTHKIRVAYQVAAVLFPQSKHSLRIYTVFIPYPKLWHPHSHKIYNVLTHTPNGPLTQTIYTVFRLYPKRTPPFANDLHCIWPLSKRTLSRVCSIVTTARRSKKGTSLTL